MNGSAPYAVRRAKPADIQRIGELRWQMRVEEGEVPIIGLPEFLDLFSQRSREPERQEYTFFVAESGGEIVGVVSLAVIAMLPRPCRPDDAFGYLTNLYVVPACRRRGMGRGLMDAAVGFAREQDLELVIAWPSDQGSRLYESVEFRSPGPLQRILRQYG